MQSLEISPDSACWKAEISESERHWKTVRTAIGELPVEDLDRSIDVEEFVSNVWNVLACRGYMLMTLCLAGTDVVWISSENIDEGPQINELTYNSDVCPAGLGGSWIVCREMFRGEEEGESRSY